MPYCWPSRATTIVSQHVSQEDAGLTADLIQQGSSNVMWKSFFHVYGSLSPNLQVMCNCYTGRKSKTHSAYFVCESISKETLSFYSISWHSWLNKHEAQHPVSKVSSLFRAPRWVTANSRPWKSEPVLSTREGNGHYSIFFPCLRKFLENVFALVKSVFLANHSESEYWACLAWLTF